MIHILGVDPGLSGAFAILSPEDNRLIDLIDTPTTKKANKREIDCYRLATYLDLRAKFIRYAVIEDVGAMPKQGVVSMFTFGKVTGIVIGMLAVYNIPIYYVKPAIWKFQLGLNKDKKKSIAKAKELWEINSYNIKNDGQAEAALLAHFGKRFWNA